MSVVSPAPRVAVLISGRGSNLAALIEAQHAAQLGGRIVQVISNRPEAGGLQLAADAGIDATVIDHRSFTTREVFDATLVDALIDTAPDLICLAGFMRILTPVFTEAFAGRVLNIHPSLLPAYPGLHTHQRAIDARDSHGGASVHYVTSELDGGPVVLQARVPIAADDTEASLASRVLKVEHEIFPEAARWHLSGRLRLTGDGAVLDGEKLAPGGVTWGSTQ